MNYSYLSERQYKNEKKGTRYNADEILFWQSILGDEALQQFLDESENARGYFGDEDYILKKSEEKRQKGLFQEHSIKEVHKEKTSAPTDKEQTVLFYPFYKPIADCVNKKVCEKYTEDDFYTTNAEEELEKMIVEALQDISSRTLIQDIHVCHQEGRLSGADTKEEYNDYVYRYLSDPVYIRRILNQYPILERCLIERMETLVMLIQDMRDRFRKDSRKIIQEICEGNSFEKVIHIQGNLSDAHNGGKSVLILELDNGYKVLYKPHSVHNEVVFQNMVQILGEECGISMFQYKIISGGDYGWTEYVEYADVKTRVELDRYYERIGIYLALTYILGTNDIHCENLIAHGQYPVIIDVENLFAYQEEMTNNTYEGIWNRLNSSVLTSGILPFLYWNEEEQGVNLSALCGRGGQTYPFKIPVVDHPYTSDICITYEHPISLESENCALLNGSFIAPYEFLDHIVDGYIKAYDNIRRHKIQWIRRIEALGTVTSRYLTADTQRYAMTLYGAYHPILLDDGAKRELYLNLMWEGRKQGDQVDRAIVESEIVQLLHQDIPYFYGYSGSRDLYSGDQVVVSDYFPECPIKRVIDKVKSLNEKDKQMQVHLIKASVELEQCGETDLMNDTIPYIPDMKAKTSDESDINEWDLVRYLTQKLLQDAVYNPKGKMQGWYAIHVNSFGNLGWNVHPLDRYAYDGQAGITYYFFLLNQMLKKQNNTRYQQLSEDLVFQLLEYTDAVVQGIKDTDSGRTGLLNGESSIPYVYLNMYELEQDERYLTYAKRHADMVLTMLEQDEAYDLLDGISGAGILLCKLYTLCKEEKYLRAAEAIAKELEQRAEITENSMSWRSEEQQPLLGMAHGTSGVAYFYGLIALRTQKEKYTHIIEKILNYENERFNENTGNWYDYRIPEETDEFKQADPVAWCHGAGGILLTRLLLEQIDLGACLNHMIQEDIQKAVNKLKATPYRDGACLCHGTAGNIWILRKYNQVHYDEQIEECIQQGERRLQNQIMTENYVPQEKCNPGIMSGYMGPALYFLSALATEKK